MNSAPLVLIAALLAQPGGLGYPTGTGYQQIQDEGTARIMRRRLNFTGTGVSCTDNDAGLRTNCDVSGQGISWDGGWTQAENLRVNNRLEVSGPATFDAGVYINGSLTVDGGVTVVGGLTTTGFIKGPTEIILSSAMMIQSNTVLASGNTFGGYVLPDDAAFTVTAMTLYVTSTGVSAGAGNTVIRVSDGTNNCDATWSCTADTNTLGSKRKATTGDCAFAAGAALIYSTNSAGCASTQVGTRGIVIHGKWQ